MEHYQLLSTYIRGEVLLVIAAIVIRTSGAALRTWYSNLLSYISGGILCATGAWLAASTLGALFPLWPAFGVGLIVGLLTYRSQDAKFWIATDLVILLLAGLMSIPPLPITAILATMILVAGGSFFIERLFRGGRGPIPAMHFAGACVVLAIALIGIGLAKGNTLKGKLDTLTQIVPASSLLPLGIIPADEGEKIAVGANAIAWLDRPAGKGPHPAALYFHGANRYGSQQSSAVVIRRAFVNAGFIVLALDHPGYGESPVPTESLSADAWDPLPASLSALAVLRSRADVDKQRIFVVGHSMGTIGVFQLAGTERDVAAGIVFGAALNDPDANIDYWYDRFHSDRRMRKRISKELFREIRKRFSDTGRMVAALGADHAPIIFVRFGWGERPDLAATRDTLYASIPGRKSTWNLSRSSHYFNSIRLGNLILADTNIARALVPQFRLLTENVDGFPHCPSLCRPSAGSFDPLV